MAEKYRLVKDLIMKKHGSLIKGIRFLKKELFVMFRIGIGY